MTTVAEQIIETLQALHVDDVFTLCGNHVLPFYEAMRQRDIRVIDTRSEAAAVMAADAYARTRRRPGVALVTGGPGFTNTLTGILTAGGNRSPVVVMSGEPTLQARNRGSHQELDIAGVAAPITRWCRAVTSAAEAQMALLEAFRVATGAAGPAVVSFPLDVQRSPAPGISLPASAALPYLGVAPPEVVERASTLLEASRRPAIIARAGAWQNGGESALLRLADAGLPVFTLDSARGIVSDSHPAAFGYADPTLNPTADLLATADCVVVLGNEVDFRMNHGALFSRDAAVIHIDQDLASLGRTRPTDMACLADPAAFAAQLADGIEDLRIDAAWIAELSAARDAGRSDLAMLARDDSAPFHPAAVASVVDRVGSAADAFYVLDCGEFVQWCRQGITVNLPGHWIRLGPQSTCGAGLPYGLGVAAAAPDGAVLVIAGDGGIGYHIAELETAVRRGLPVTVLVGQDGAWGVERNLQLGVYGEQGSFASELGPTDFVRVAEGFGAEARAPSTLSELERDLAHGLASHRVTLIEVPVRAEMSGVTRSLITRERAAADASNG